MNNKTCLLLAACLVTLFSCKKPPTVTNKVIPTTQAQPDTISVLVEEVDFQYFSAKSKVNFKDQNQDQTANVNVRIQKDSLIWLSVNKVNIEGFRALITQDSIYLLDKLNDRFVVKDFKSLSEEFNFPINYQLLQSVLLGNLPFSIPNRRGLQVDNYYLLRTTQGPVTVTNFVGTANKKVEKVEMVEKPTNNSLTLNYANFGPLNNFLFPYNSALYLKYQRGQKNLSTLITIEVKKAEIHADELKFPFNIPKRYERK